VEIKIENGSIIESAFCYWSPNKHLNIIINADRRAYMGVGSTTEIINGTGKIKSVDYYFDLNDQTDFINFIPESEAERIALGQIGFELYCKGQWWILFTNNNDIDQENMICESSEMEKR